MKVKEEVVNVEISYKELARIIMPNLFAAGFDITEINESKINLSVADTGEIIAEHGAIIKFKKVSPE